jgi:hypothetical protein
MVYRFLISAPLVLVPTLQRGNAVKPLQRFVCARARGTLERGSQCGELIK